MERVPERSISDRYAIESRGRSSEFISIEDIGHFLRRYALTISIVTVFFAVLSALMVYSAKTLYTARAQVLIDPRVAQIQREQIGELVVPLDTAQIESQLALLRSESMARSVVAALDLTKDPEFQIDSSSIWTKIQRRLPSWWPSIYSRLNTDKAGDPGEKALREAIVLFQSGMDVARVGISYGIDIAFSAQDPDKAARIANTVALLYVRDQLETRRLAAQAGGVWLEEKINLIRRKMNAAARTAQEFKATRDYRLLPSSANVGPKIPAAADQQSAANAGAAARQFGITLDELESTAQTYKKLYESYLLAYTEALQRDSYPVSNARVISQAIPPMTKSYPKTQLTLVLGALIGALLGISLSLIHYSLDRRVVSSAQIRDGVGLECLALLPAPSSAAPKSKSGRRFSVFHNGVPGRADATLRQFGLGEITTYPFSRFSEGIKSIKTHVQLSDRSGANKVLGITSILGEEGKSAVAANLATLYAISGTRVLLIDADMRNPQLSHALSDDIDTGLLEVLAGEADVYRTIRNSESAHLDILPMMTSTTPLGMSELLGSPGMRTLLQRMTERYDIIIVNLPPIHPAGEGLALSNLLGAVLLVVEWGSTRVEVVHEAANSLRRAKANIIGAVLTTADARYMENLRTAA